MRPAPYRSMVMLVLRSRAAREQLRLWLTTIAGLGAGRIRGPP
jgi:hypothetical protein